MPISATDLNKAYLAYFGRPADLTGKTYFATLEQADVIKAFDASAESKASYGDNVASKVNAIYQNLFNRDAEPEGLVYWTTLINQGRVTAAGAALAILNGAQGTDTTAVTNKLAASEAFVAALNTTPELVGYSGMEAAASARSWLKAVGADAASLTAAIAGVDAAVTAAVAVGGVPGATFTLTTGIDGIVGGAGNDTFNSSPVSGVATFSGLDSIDGGAGTDTLNIDFGATAAALSTTANIKNIEVLNVASTASVNVNVSNIAGITNVSAVNGAVAGTTAAQTVVTGGKVVTVNGGIAAAAATDADAAVTVSGNELTSVSVKNTAEITAGVTNSKVIVNNTAAAGTGKTLTSVTLENLGTDIATLTGDALNSVTVKGQKTALATTVVNTVSTDLTVNVDGAGYNAAGTAVAGVSVTAGAKAATITVNATGSKSNVTVAETTAGAAKTLNLTGSANLALGTVGASLTGLTTIAGAAATGNLNLGALGASAAAVTTGSGNDTFAVGATKVTVDAGAGNDKVTLNTILALGSTVNLGAGNDVLLDGTAGAVTGKDATGTVVIDAGEGTDSVAASLVNAANATQFLNFEQIDLSGATTNTILDIALMTGSTITGLTLNGGTGGNAVQNLAAGAGLTVAGANTGATTIGVKGASTGTADAFTVTFAGADVAGAAATVANVTAGTIAVAGIEALTIASNGGSNTWNSIDLGLNKALKTITITGDKNLDLTFGAPNGADTVSATAGVSSIDGSAATGKLKITVDADVKAVTTGLVVKGGSAADTITTGAASTTLTGNAGADAFDVTAAKAGAGAATVAILEAAAVKTTIADFVKGETIQFAATAAVATAAVTKITLDATVQNLDQALDKVAATAGTYWFNYGADTYVVVNNAADAGLDEGDVIVKLTGTLDLSNSTTTDNVLTFA